jgi:hypothetical protein
MSGQKNYIVALVFDDPYKAGFREIDSYRDGGSGNTSRTS